MSYLFHCAAQKQLKIPDFPIKLISEKLNTYELTSNYGRKCWEKQMKMTDVNPGCTVGTVGVGVGGII